MVKNPGQQIAGNPLSVVDIGWYGSIMFSQNKNPGFQLFDRPLGGHYSHPKKCQKKVNTHFRSEQKHFSILFFWGGWLYTAYLIIYTYDIFQYSTIFPLYPIDILKYSHDIFTIFPLSDDWIMIQHDSTYLENSNPSIFKDVPIWLMKSMVTPRSGRDILGPRPIAPPALAWRALVRATPAPQKWLFFIHGIIKNGRWNIKHGMEVS